MDENLKPEREPAEERALRFLAQKHPDDEAALEAMTGLLEANQDDEWMETLYRGLNYGRDVKAASEQGYVKGRNEQIELLRKELRSAVPTDDGGHGEDWDLPLLRHIRKSVWDD